MGCLEGERHWDPNLCRHLNDWEVDEVEGLFLRLGTKNLFLEGVDKPRWEETQSRGFSTKAMYWCWRLALTLLFP